jgi:hypothetical protein
MNKTSLRKLATAHDDLQKLAHWVDKRYPIQIICGVRHEKEQNEAFDKGFSKLKFPESKHNINPAKMRIRSHAIDAVPDPDKNPATIEWNEIDEFEKMCLVFEQGADELGIKIRLGRDFKIKDFPHIELA